MDFWALDSYALWGKAAVDVANLRGHRGRLVAKGEEVEDGWGFIRLSMEPHLLAINRLDYKVMAERLLMVQDQTQIDIYEDKSAQFALWSEWMPPTWRFTDCEKALAFIGSRDQWPLVSKADPGASSINVRILTKEAAEKHVRQAFSEQGIPIYRRNPPQKGYVLLQEFIPHKITYRVNALGDCRSVFFRYCYPDKPVAQTGNVDPCMEMTPEIESLLEFSDRFFAHAGTKWCAIDVLKDGESWKLLETSEGWPWPSPGTCNSGPIFRSKNRRWIEMFEVMFDELERGAFHVEHASSSRSTSPATCSSAQSSLPLGRSHEKPSQVSSGGGRLVEESNAQPG